MVSIVGILIAIMVITTLGAAIAFLIFAIVRASYKKKLNKRLQEDNSVIAEGKTPERNRNHLSEPSYMVPIYIILCALTCILTINFVTLFYTLSDLKEEQSYANDALDDVAMEIYDLQEALEALNNPIASSSVEADWENFDTTTHCVPVKLTLTLKEWSAETLVSIKIDDALYPATYEDGAFAVTVSHNIFSSSRTMYLLIERDGVYKTQALDYNDYLGSVSYLNAFGWVETTFEGGFRLDYNSVTKQYEPNEEFERFIYSYDIERSALHATITSATLQFLVNDEVIASVPLHFANGQAIVEADEILPLSAPQNSTISMQVTYTNSLGYTFKTEDVVTGDQDGWANDVIAPDGTIVYKASKYLE